MPAKRPEYPKVITYGSGRVRISKRGNGFFAIAWRELGSNRTTTKATEPKALKWAQEKARELDAGTGNQWMSAASAEIIKELGTIAGEGEGAIRRLLEEMKAAKHWLGGIDTISTAAKYFAEHGPLKVSRATIKDTVKRFLDEYQERPVTLRTFGTELNAFITEHPEHALLIVSELDEETLGKWVKRKVNGKENPAPRTLRNRITTWVTFLNRARDWKLLPPGKHVAEILRRPVIPDAGKEILTVEQGAALLVAVREKDPRLEAYLLIAGWLGLRPSECQRLTWSGFQWTRGYLHVTHAVAGKTSQERYVPVDATLLKLLKHIFAAGKFKPGDKICPFRAREYLSVLARQEKILRKWPADVLRHSFCSYRLAIVQDLAKVAEEAGNSPAIIKSNYRRPLMPDDGQAWWAILKDAA